MSPHEIEEQLRRLNNDYKLFKKKNPSAQAKLPPKIKTLACRLSDAGVKTARLASVLGLTRSAIYRWLNTENPPPLPGTRTSDWISIRINGKRIDVSKKDFRKLLME